MKNTGKNDYYLMLYPSEGGDFVRAYSKVHKHEIYLYDGYEIIEYIVQKNNVKIYLSKNAEPLFIKKIDLEWVCNNCNERFKFDQKFCPDCKV